MTSTTTSLRSSFFIRHRNLLTVIGAIIVFATFIIKDAVREHVKDVVDSLNAARNLYFSRQDSRVLVDILDGVWKDVIDIKNASSQKSANAKAINRENMKLAFLQLQMNYNDIKLMVDQVAVLYSALPKSKRDEQFKGLQDSLRNLQEREQWLSVNLNDPHLSDDVMVSKLVDTSRLGSKIVAESQDIVQQAMQAFYEERHRKQQLYRDVTWASYVFYAFGWALGIVGRVSGDKDEVIE